MDPIVKREKAQFVLNCILGPQSLTFSSKSFLYFKMFKKG
jgi:hypothetical protein